jgi:hypothetical protein
VFQKPSLAARGYDEKASLSLTQSGQAGGRIGESASGYEVRKHPASFWNSVYLVISPII